MKIRLQPKKRWNPMFDGKKSGKLKAFLRTLRGITKLGRFAPGPVGLIMGIVNEGAVAAEVLNGPGTGREKHEIVFRTAQNVINALEGEGLFKVDQELKDYLSDVIDAVVADQNALGVLPKNGEPMFTPEESLPVGESVPVFFHGKMTRKPPGTE